MRPAGRPKPDSSAVIANVSGSMNHLRHLIQGRISSRHVDLIQNKIRSEKFTGATYEEATRELIN
jgi:hypothetical protein